MAERIDAAVQVQVDQPAAVHVIEVIALAPVDHEVDALVAAIAASCRDSRPSTVRAMKSSFALLMCTPASTLDATGDVAAGT